MPPPIIVMSLGMTGLSVMVALIQHQHWVFEHAADIKRFDQ